MDKKTKALKLALEALLSCSAGDYSTGHVIHPSFDADAVNKAIEAIDALAEQPAQEPCIKCKGLGYYDEGHECDDGSMAGGNYVECDKCKQPDFIKHEVENAYDWSEWVCPDPESYLMKCCDCGLVHEAQFRVAKYKPAPSDECEVVSDPDLQAQFRMRRSEQWSPADTAHRPGGLPMAEQPAQQEPVAIGWQRRNGTLHRGCPPIGEDDGWTPLYTTPPAAPASQEEIQRLSALVRAQQITIEKLESQRQWVGLTEEEIQTLLSQNRFAVFALVRAIEAKLREKNEGKA